MDSVALNEVHDHLFPPASAPEQHPATTFDHASLQAIFPHQPSDPTLTSADFASFHHLSQPSSLAFRPQPHHQPHPHHHHQPQSISSTLLNHDWSPTLDDGALPPSHLNLNLDSPPFQFSSSLDPQLHDVQQPDVQQDTQHESNVQHSQITPQTSDQQQMNTAIIDDFFLKNGAYRPPVPCQQCKRQKLQCLILQTTAANPNPITSCSSCVALFRDCSLAERSKRQASSFETQGPVIGHLHGVNEEDDTMLPRVGEFDHLNNDPSASLKSAKRGGSRPLKKTRALVNWFAGHLDHPYPSEEEKVLLGDQCGMSKTQVANWFANARRRHRTSAQSLFNNNSTKVFRQGSPMPQSILSRMSPLERWRSSPPSDEAASASAISSALETSSQDGSEYYGSYGSSRSIRHGRRRSRRGSARGSISSNSGDSAIYGGNDASSHSQSVSSSVHSQRSGDMQFNLSARNSFDAGDATSAVSDKLASAAPAPAKTNTFQCTFCRTSFRKRYDWVRHERSIHLPGLDSWICSVPLSSDQSFLVWRLDHDQPECIFCGHSSPTHEHIQSHDFASCAGRPVAERSFTRKDHLWQHLHKFHRCKKWEGWRPNLGLLQHRQDKVQSKCGFCQVTLNSWDERAQHLASHFRKGATMADWTGGPGIQLPEDQMRM